MHYSAVQSTFGVLNPNKIIFLRWAGSRRAPAKAVKYDVGELKDGADWRLGHVRRSAGRDLASPIILLPHIIGIIASIDG